MLKQFQRIIHADRGVSAIEYAIIACMISITAMVAWDQTGTKINDTLLGIDTAITVTSTTPGGTTPTTPTGTTPGNNCTVSGAAGSSGGVATEGSGTQNPESVPVGSGVGVNAWGCTGTFTVSGSTAGPGGETIETATDQNGAVRTVTTFPDGSITRTVTAAGSGGAPGPLVLYENQYSDGAVETAFNMTFGPEGGAPTSFVMQMSMPGGGGVQLERYTFEYTGATATINGETRYEISKITRQPVDVNMALGGEPQESTFDAGSLYYSPTRGIAWQ